MSMKYDFTTILDREGTGAIAVSKIPFDNAEIKEGFSKIPMWVADMNYATAPSVIEAIQNRLAHPVFGYFDIKDAYSESIVEWQKIRNGVTDIPKEAIDYENGVLGGVSSGHPPYHEYPQHNANAIPPFLRLVYLGNSPLKRK